jgi:ribokinase
VTAAAPGAGSADGHRFAVVGAYVIDCIARTDRMPDWGETHEGESVHMAPGGKALNMAVALARMGAHVDAIGVVGDDLAGQTVVDALVREGVGIEGLEIRPGGRTPICVCFSRNTDGETAFLWRIDDSVAMDSSTMHGVGRAPLEAADATIITFEAPAAVGEAVTIAKNHGSLVALQPSPANAGLDLRSLPWEGVQVLVPNAKEATALVEAIGPREVGRQHLAETLAVLTGVVPVVVTLGAEGVSFHGQTGTHHRPAPSTGRIVDSSGASDAFTASLVWHLARANDLHDAVDRSQLAASNTLGDLGTLVPAPANDVNTSVQRH